MATTNIRSSETDTYTILSNSGVSYNNAETTFAQILVQSAYDRQAIVAPSGIYNSPITDLSNIAWTVEDISTNSINTSAIANYPNGTVTEYSVITSQLITGDVSYNSYTTNISSNACANNTYTFSMLPTSSSYYDSNYVFEQSLIADCSDNVTGTYVNANFDVDASNAKIQYAMQSRWNTVLGPYTGLTTVGQDPTAVTQDVSFNTEVAFAEKGTGATDASYVSYWFSANSDGSLTSHEVDASYQPIENNFLVADRDMSGVSLNVDEDVGIFRIQQASQLVTTKISLNDGSFSTITGTQLTDIPLFNGYPTVPLQYNSSKSSSALNVPGQMIANEFETLFAPDVYNTVADGWTYIVDISSNGGGYDISGNHPLMSSLNNNNLLDNPYYMENYVSNDHTITFSDASINIAPSTDGQSSVSGLISIDLSNGETLSQTYAGVDGQIILNSNTPSTRYTDLTSTNVNGNNVVPYVYYSDDGAYSISGDQTTNEYFKGMWQKVAQQSSTTSSQYYLEDSNNAIMTLYTNSVGIVDNSYNASDFDFSFNNTLFLTNDINLWKINVSNNLIMAPQSFYTDPSYDTLVTGIATSGSITDLTEAINYNGYRIKLTAKVKEDLSLQAAVSAVNGWTLSYSNPSDTFLQTSAAQAYSEHDLPIYNNTIIDAINSGTNLPFAYYYKTRQSANRVGGLVDYVEIDYSYNGVNYAFTVPQVDIARVYNDASMSYTVVVDPYTFTNGYSTDFWELVHVTAQTSYSATFFADFGPFTNINLTVQDIQQTDVYYAVRNKVDGGFAPQSILQFVNAPSITNLTEIDETITPLPGNSLSISGTFTANDLKPFRSVTQGENTNNTWTNIGSLINTDVYYGLANEDNLTPTGTVVSYIEYTPFSNSILASVNVNLTGYNYYIPFVYDQSNNAYVLESFSASKDTLAANTNIGSGSFAGNTSYLNLTNGYSNATNWVTTQYTLTETHDPVDGTITLTAKNLSNTQVFSISVLNNTVFLGEYIVSYIPLDYYRTERLLGASVLSNTYAEQFITTNYPSGQVQLGSDPSGILYGLSIGDTTPISLSSSNTTLGSYQTWRVLGDFMNINEIGTTTVPTSTSELGLSTYNGGSLVFQDVSGSNYSAAFTFPIYRGYYSYSVNTNQYYTINRDATVATFNVAGAGSLSALTDVIASNMYYNQTFNVNNLQNTSNQLVANLGITGSFYYSIPPTGSTLTYTVNVTGDHIFVDISNNNYLGTATNIPVDPSATPVVDPKTYSDIMTLKDYGRDDVYTFSGNWYATGNLMAFRPSRVKLNNTAFPYNRTIYRISVESDVIPIYKALNTGSDISFNWLGNPAIHGSQDPDSDPEPTYWYLYGTYTMQDIIDGVNIGTKRVYQNPLLPAGFRIVYIVSAPPYYKFDQISTENCPEIPYDYDVSYNANRTTRYVPVVDPTTGSVISTFNPFAPSTVYTDISNNTTNVVSNPEYLNNITFTLPSAPSMTTMVESPNSTRYGIIVPGTNLKVYFYDGSYNSTSNGNHTNPIWDAPITSIPSTPNINNNALILRSRSNNGNILFSALQYPVDLGYPAGPEGYIEVLHTDVSSNWYNIDFNMGNTAWFNNNSPITYFDANAHGIRPTLYTVVDINDPSTQKNKRRIYKYTTNGTIDIDISGGSGPGYQTFNLTFNSREYADFDITMSSTFPSLRTLKWQYNILLNNTVIPGTDITWTTDSSFSSVAYVSWAFGNSSTATDMLVKIFGVRDEEVKGTYIHLFPFMRYMNQFYMQVGSVEWDGTAIAPAVSTRVVNLAPGIVDPVLINSTYAIQEYSEQGLQF